MNQPRPRGDGISRESQLRPHLPFKFRKNDVNRNRIRIETVRACIKNQVMGNSAESPVPPAPHMISAKPPNEIHKMRPGNFRNAMPSESREIEIFHSLAINVDVIIASEPRSPFGNAAFRSMPLINERRDDREDGFRASHQISVRDLHRLTPALQNEKRPDARPADASWVIQESLPDTLHRRRVQNSRGAHAVGAECRVHFRPQFAGQPVGKWKRKSALRGVRQSRGRYSRASRYASNRAAISCAASARRLAWRRRTRRACDRGRRAAAPGCGPCSWRRRRARGEAPNARECRDRRLFRADLLL